MTSAQIEWYSKEEAAVRLGSPDRPLSPRRVLELAKEGKIDSGRTRDPNTGQTVVRLHAGSVERYLEQKRNPAPVPPPEARGVREPQALARRGSELMELVRVLRDGCANRAPARLWLTLAEAADYSGLPAAILVRCITDGRLPAIDVGRRRGGRWRIRKVDLGKIDPFRLEPTPKLLTDM
jgi:excisionase family DNA binding protein